MTWTAMAEPKGRNQKVGFEELRLGIPDTETWVARPKLLSWYPLFLVGVPGKPTGKPTCWGFPGKDTWRMSRIHRFAPINTPRRNTCRNNINRVQL